MIKPAITLAKAPAREIELFDPPAGAIYSIEATARLVDISRRFDKTFSAQNIKCFGEQRTIQLSRKTKPKTNRRRKKK
jgi:hypothetical protein